MQYRIVDIVKHKHFENPMKVIRIAPNYGGYYIFPANGVWEGSRNQGRKSYVASSTYITLIKRAEVETEEQLSALLEGM